MDQVVQEEVGGHKDQVTVEDHVHQVLVVIVVDGQLHQHQVDQVGVDGLKAEWCSCWWIKRSWNMYVIY